MTSAAPSTLGALPSRGRQRTQQADANALALQAASMLLTRPWLARLPLIDEGASTTLQQGMFTEVSVLAVRWPGPAVGPISHCAVAIPTVALEGLAETCEVHHVQLQDLQTLAPMEENCEVAVLYFGAEFLKESLAEGCPTDAAVLTFASPDSRGIPIASQIFDWLDVPSDFTSGTIAKTVLNDDMTSRVVVYDASMAADETQYVTAASGVDDDPINPLLVLSAPVSKKRRPASANVAVAEPSVLGSGQACSPRLGALSAVLTSPVTTAVPKRRAAGAKATAAAQAPAPPQPTLKDVLDAVTGLSSRVAALERAPAPTSATSPPQACPSSLLTPGRFGAPPKRSETDLLQGQHAPAHALGPVLPPRVVQAQQLVSSLPGPPGLATEGERMARERATDATLREAVERGGTDAQTAVQLAMLAAIQKIAGQRNSSDEFDDLVEDEDFESNMGKITSGARGAAALMRVHHLIEKNPNAWSARLDRSMWTALGCDHTNLPWSAHRYFTERVTFGRHVELE
eukprot:6053436-Amphidinium_carterae.1